MPTARQAALLKIAGSALRERVTIEERPGLHTSMLGPNKQYLMLLDGKPIGEMQVNPKKQSVAWSRVDDKYHGMGLGKKLYGEVMKRQPGGVLRSDSNTSDKAMAVWESTKKRGYIIDPGKTLEVKGWRTSQDSVASFRFSGVGASYANLKHGNTRNVGVVGLAVFTEKGIDPFLWMPGEVKRRHSASPFAEAPMNGAR